MDRGAWQATVHGVAELEMTEHVQASNRLTGDFFPLNLNSSILSSFEQ